MRKALYIVKQQWKTMGSSYVLVLILIMISSFCISYCCMLPIDRAIYYARYGETGMENSAILNMNFVQHEKWGQGNYRIADVPEYAEVTKIVDSFADRALSVCCSATFGDDNRVSLYVYNDVLVDNVNLPNDVSQMLQSANLSEDVLPVVIDDRLRSLYAIGDVLPDFRLRSAGSPTMEAQVVGYINKDSDFLYSTSSGSNPSIVHMISHDDTERYVAISITNSALGVKPDDYVYSTLLLFPKNGEDIETVIDAWKKIIRENGLGSIETFREMRWTDLTMPFIGSDNVLGLMSIWSLLLILVGLRGYIANLSIKMTQYVAVYRLHGMSRSKWYAILLLAYSIPISTVVCIPQLMVIYMFFPMVQPVSIFGLFLIGFIIDSFLIIPMVLDTIRCCKDTQIHLVYAERGI